MTHEEQQVPELDNADVWDEGRERDDLFRSEQEWRQLEELHGNAGYREGAMLEKPKILQRGFDQGFHDGTAIGLEAGRLLGLCSALKVYAHTLQQRQVESNLDQLLQEMTASTTVENVVSPEYMQKQDNRLKPYNTNDHVLLSRFKTEIINAATQLDTQIVI